LEAIQKDEKHFDFDLQVKVIQMFVVDAYTAEIRVIDETSQIWHA